MYLEELECATLKITQNNFTREDTLGSRSFIDHIIVTNHVSYTYLNVLYNGHNLADHNPVTIQTNHNVTETRNNLTRYRVINWENVTEENIEN